MGLVCALLSCARRRADRKEHRQRQKKYSRAGEGDMPKADPAQHASGHRADHRPQFTAYRKQRKPLGATAFPVGLAEGTGPRQQGLYRRGEQAPPTPVRQAPRIMGHSDAPHASRRKPATRTTQPARMIALAP